jgi:hypothetical protein
VVVEVAVEPGDDGAAVTLHLCTADGQQIGGRHTVPGQKPVQVRGRGITRGPGVHHEDPPARAGQHQGGGQTEAPPPMMTTS